MMSGCAAVVVLEAVESSNLLVTFAGIALGILVMRLLDMIPTEGLVFDQVKGERARKCLLLFWSVLIHSIGEGLCIGSSAVSAHGTGYLVTACIALHNIPEGAAIAPAFFLLRGESDLVPLGLGFASGCMASIVCTDIV